MAERLVSVCGLVCSECPAYLATLSNDEEKAREVAAGWSQAFGITVAVSDVWCDGCLPEGRKCAHCNQCEIRACGVERGFDNCAACADYACDKLEPLFKMAPAARDTLDALRA